MPRSFLVALCCSALLACGGAAPESAGPKSPAPVDAAPSADAPVDTKGAPTPEPRTIGEAEDAIAEARAALEPSNAPREQPAGKTDKKQEPKPSLEPSRKEGEAACPCRALASMHRAVEALCRMAGEADPRCVEARRTLGASTTRMSSCACH